MPSDEFGYRDPEAPRGGCMPLSVLLFLAIAVFGVLFLVCLWWFTSGS